VGTATNHAKRSTHQGHHASVMRIFVNDSHQAIESQGHLAKRAQRANDSRGDRRAHQRLATLQVKAVFGLESNTVTPKDDKTKGE
jgi:thiamine kinase-like enzyme